MSFILNALRKSEQERLSNHTETLEDKILIKQIAVQKNKPAWLIILILINFLLLAFLVWHFTLQEEEGINGKPVMVSEQIKTPVQIKEEKTIIASKHPIAPVKVKEEKTVTALKQPIAPVQIKEDNIATTAKQPITPVQIKEDKTVTTLKQPIAPVQIKEDKTAQVQDSRLIASAQQMKNQQEVKKQKPGLVRNSKEKSPPYLSEMPYEFRLSVPKININVFVYTDHPSERFIMVNMQKYQVGQQINKDMELQEIRPDSIVVEFKNKIFQIKR